MIIEFILIAILILILLYLGCKSFDKQFIIVNKKKNQYKCPYCLGKRTRALFFIILKRWRVCENCKNIFIGKTRKEKP